MKNLSVPETNPAPPLPSNTAVIDTATLELLASWRAQDATNDPDELRAAEQELSEFRKAMNNNRIQAGELPLYP